MSSSNIEHVLCIPCSRLPGAWLGCRSYQHVDLRTLREVLGAAGPAWLSRDLAEQDYSFKQLIPYVIMIDEFDRMAIYRRQGRESRLHGFHSLGIGGHVNPCDHVDDDVVATVVRGAEREIKEEFLKLPSVVSLKLIGIINETESAVGKCHLGVVFVARVSDSEGARPSDELSGLRWLSVSEIKREQVVLELWSDLAMDLQASGAASCLRSSAPE